MKQLVCGISARGFICRAIRTFQIPLPGVVIVNIKQLVVCHELIVDLRVFGVKLMLGFRVADDHGNRVEHIHELRLEALRFPV